MAAAVLTTKQFHFSVCPCETLGKVYSGHKVFSTVQYLEEKALWKEDKTSPSVGTGEGIFIQGYLVMADCLF